MESLKDLQKWSNKCHSILREYTSYTNKYIYYPQDFRVLSALCQSQFHTIGQWQEYHGIKEIFQGYFRMCRRGKCSNRVWEKKYYFLPSFSAETTPIILISCPLI